MKELKESILYRGTALEQDCKDFVAAIDQSIATNFIHPVKTTAANYVEESAKAYEKHSRKLLLEKSDTTFGRFYKNYISDSSVFTQKIDENYSIVLYLQLLLLKWSRALQELIKQFCNTSASPESKEKGYTLLKIFRKIMEESEQKWFATIQYLVKYTMKLKSEVEFLLGKAMDESDVNRVMGNNVLTLENLIEHKRILKVVLGTCYTEEAKRVEMEKKVKDLQAEINEWVVGWDLLRNSKTLHVFCQLLKKDQERLQMIDREMAKLHISNDAEYKAATQEERVLLTNAQRYLMAVPYKNKWEIELDTLHKQNAKLSAECEKLKEELKKSQAKADDSIEEAKRFQERLQKINLELDYTRRKLVTMKYKQQFVEHTRGQSK
eukprot:TRINITY_DN828_c0_g1_i1.p3 TRINITY_DN828_c0_g1~~TRINITY_DN828_c0_g1_i1.p3  ORF type:complete len:380 (+),score=42.98 TRINITY_DN828_c0_g1_i1:1910-3049(+)